MALTKHVGADRNWSIPNEDSVPYPAAQLAVLQDIRAELRTLNRLLGCGNFVAVPSILREIRSNTKPRKRRRRNKTA